MKSKLSRFDRAGVMRKLKPRFAARKLRWPQRVDRRPGSAPDGWRTGPPDFIGVGVMKAGTSWWFRLMTGHPDVLAGRTTAGTKKELHFFDRFCDDPFQPTDVEDYARFFARPPDRATMCGEWTPRYMFDYWTPPLIKRAAPQAKLLVLLRDPVDRYVSGLTHDRSRGAPQHPLVAEDQFARGFYGRQLHRLRQSFERERILVLQYERCRQDPLAELERTFRFLGLALPDKAPETSQQVNLARGERFVLSDHLRDALVKEYAQDVSWLISEFPEVEVSLWPNFRS